MRRGMAGRDPRRRLQRVDRRGTYTCGLAHARAHAHCETSWQSHHSRGAVHIMLPARVASPSTLAPTSLRKCTSCTVPTTSAGDVRTNHRAHISLCALSLGTLDRRAGSAPMLCTPRTLENGEMAVLSCCIDASLHMMWRNCHNPWHGVVPNTALAPLHNRIAKPFINICSIDLNHNASTDGFPFPHSYASAEDHTTSDCALHSEEVLSRLRTSTGLHHSPNVCQRNSLVIRCAHSWDGHM